MKNCSMVNRDKLIDVKNIVTARFILPLGGWTISCCSFSSNYFKSCFCQQMANAENRGRSRGCFVAFTQPVYLLRNAFLWPNY